MIHYTGTRRYLNARGPRCLAPESTMDNSIYTGLVTSSTLMEIARVDQEYSVPLDNPEWKNNDPFISTGNNFYSGNEDFLSLIKPLPSFLRRADLVTQDASAVFDHDLYTTLNRLKQQLSRFLPANAELGEVDVAVDDHLLDVEVEEHCFIARSTIITLFHRYADADVSRDVLVSTMISLVVDCALIRLQLSPSAPFGMAQQHVVADNIRRTYQLAMLLCRGVWYISSLQSMAYLRFLTVLIGMAQQIFEQLGDKAVREYGWTQACLLAGNLRMKRLQESGAITLCFAHELGPGMRQRCRWQSRRQSIVTVHDTP